MSKHHGALYDKPKLIHLIQGKITPRHGVCENNHPRNQSQDQMFCGEDQQLEVLAPTKQNLLCHGRSVRQVVAEHSDFQVHEQIMCMHETGVLFVNTCSCSLLCFHSCFYSCILQGRNATSLTPPPTHFSYLVPRPSHFSLLVDTSRPMARVWPQLRRAVFR